MVTFSVLVGACAGDHLVGSSQEPFTPLAQLTSARARPASTSQTNPTNVTIRDLFVEALRTMRVFFIMIFLCVCCVARRRWTTSISVVQKLSERETRGRWAGGSHQLHP